MGFISDILSKALTELPVADALRERLALANDRAIQLEQKSEALQKENTTLKKEVAELREEVARYRAPADSLIHQGVLFQGISKGEDGVQIHCATCRVAASTMPHDGRFFCPKCDALFWFNRNGLAHVLSKLPRQ